MKRYDPLAGPDTEAWLSLGESERTALVANHHKTHGIKLPNLTLHAAIHVVVENQLAMHLPAVESALDRLMRDGLDRHEAIHAIGSVLAKGIHGALTNPDTSTDLNDEYERALSELTAATWRGTS